MINWPAEVEAAASMTARAGGAAMHNFANRGSSPGLS
jgi:hypothetical protein